MMTEAVEATMTLGDDDMGETEAMELDFSEASRVRRMVEMLLDLAAESIRDV